MSQDAVGEGTPDTPDVVNAGGDAPVLDIGSEAEEYERSTPMVRGRVDKTGAAMGTGRRKTAVARVRIRDGKGNITINGREFTEYFPVVMQQQAVLDALDATGKREQVDCIITCTGGGPNGQAFACKMGISRALISLDSETFSTLRGGGYLTRDSRMKERKKYGLRGARRGVQFSKR